MKYYFIITAVFLLFLPAFKVGANEIYFNQPVHNDGWVLTSDDNSESWFSTSTLPDDFLKFDYAKLAFRTETSTVDLLENCTIELIIATMDQACKFSPLQSFNTVEIYSNYFLNEEKLFFLTSPAHTGENNDCIFSENEQVEIQYNASCPVEATYPVLTVYGDNSAPFFPYLTIYYTGVGTTTILENDNFDISKIIAINSDGSTTLYEMPFIIYLFVFTIVLLIAIVIAVWILRHDLH